MYSALIRLANPTSGHSLKFLLVMFEAVAYELLPEVCTFLFQELYSLAVIVLNILLPFRLKHCRYALMRVDLQFLFDWSLRKF
jgi:hypothetical protein